jgi:iron complex outermembrane receptor protein
MKVLLFLAIAPAALLAQTADSSQARRDSTQRLEGVTVSAIRAPDHAPVFASKLDAAAIQRRSFGQDVPLLLQGTTSLTSHSETGYHWGYSYLRLRGIDQSRINLTLDGIPLNDPEDQVLYFADFPDLASSLSSIQVQRGVGTSAPGTASYGGSINFQTTPFASTVKGAEAQLQLGAFSSRRVSLGYSTGLDSSRFALTARVSAMRSNGYRKHSGTNGISSFLSLGWVGERDVFKFTSISGSFRDTLAYYGATRAEIAVDERSNILRRDETDQFSESVTALSHTRASGGLLLSNTLYRIAAGGNYFLCVFQCEMDVGAGALMYSQNLDFVWHGATSAVSVGRGATRLSGGVNVNDYARDHHAYEVAPMKPRLYFNTGHKNDASIFAKLERDLGPVTLFGDLQGRFAKFRYEPDDNAGIVERSIAWEFFNPKAGATLRMGPAWTAYASYGVNHREPARGDLLAGFDNLDSTMTAFVGPFSRLSPERVHDIETGMRRRGARLDLDVNVFLMQFHNEILPIGALSVYGLPLRTNVKSSRRRGIETELSAHATSRLRVGLGATIMRARIAEFTDGASGLTYQDVPPLLTPEFTTTQTASLEVMKSVTIDFTGKFVGNSRLTNTDDPTLALHSQYTSDFAARWTLGSMDVSFLVNNATNVRRFAGGHAAGTDARFYILPPRNAHLLFRFRT